ncbi:MAG: cell surface protein SprA, partial [Bacteroidaceae bacterium]|nr:cell surface protein SprA [Bacteroidaceae bacterium]
IRNLKIDVNASRLSTEAKSIQYMYQGRPTTRSGNFTMTTISLGSAFESRGDATNGFYSKSFEKFCNSLPQFRQRVEDQYAGSVYPQGTHLAGKTFDPAQYGGVKQYSADVLIPAFLSNYTLSGGSSLDIFPSLAKLLPNWTIRYSGLSQLPFLSQWFKSVNINHAYKSVYAVGAYTSYSTFMEYMNGLGFVTDTETGNPRPSSMFNVSTVSINESFSPLIGVDMTFYNNLTAKVEYRKTRVLSLSTTSIQLNEASSNDLVIGLAYKINNLKLFSWGQTKRKAKSKNKKDDEANKKNETKNTTSKNGFNNDLNLRLDVSFRDQVSITRDIATITSTASSGNQATKIAFSAEYMLSRLLSLSFYYDFQKNVPLLTSSSYPTTTQDFGLSIKFSLTR